MAEAEVAEFQGLYGPYTVSEILVQKIWMRGLFQQDGLTTADARRVQVRHPGEWNRIGGPDFKRARLVIDGKDVSGDVEVHFRQEDWFRHGHGEDEAYRKVVLHVVLFPPKQDDAPAKTIDGNEIPCVVLLDRLYHDLEEYAMDDLLSAAFDERRGRLLESLLEQPLRERRERLVAQACKRWAQKVYFARMRLEKLEWDEACHQTAMEGLGYRANRGPMLAVAARFPLQRLVEERPRAESLVGAVPDTWARDGLRPANHPVVRLEQYLNWVKHRPAWPGRLAEEIAGWPGIDEAPGDTEALLELAPAFRRDYELPLRHRRLAEFVAAGAVPGTRFTTLVCDGFLPLAAAGGEQGLFPYWFYWYTGDAPESVREILKTAEITDGRTISQSNGWTQGVLYSVLG